MPSIKAFSISSFYFLKFILNFFKSAMVSSCLVNILVNPFWFCNFVYYVSFFILVARFEMYLYFYWLRYCTCSYFLTSANYLVSLFIDCDNEEISSLSLHYYSSTIIIDYEISGSDFWAWFCCNIIVVWLFFWM